MATVKIKELRDLDETQLADKSRDLKHEVLNLRIQQETGQLENPARLRTIRREVARIETVLSERRIQAKASA